MNRDRANADLKKKRRSKRYRVDRKNRMVLSQDFQSEYFTRFEVEAICQYFKQRFTPDFFNQLGKKMIADSKNVVRQWNAEDVRWQKTILKEVEESRQPIFFRHNVTVPKPTLGSTQKILQVSDSGLERLHWETVRIGPRSGVFAAVRQPQDSERGSYPSSSTEKKTPLTDIRASHQRTLQGVACRRTQPILTVSPFGFCNR